MLALRDTALPLDEAGESSPAPYIVFLV